MANTVYWTMKDGTKISVDDMDVNHLRNTLKMIIRNIDHKKRYDIRDIKINGDIAQSMIDDAIDQDLRDSYGIDDYPEFY